MTRKPRHLAFHLIFLSLVLLMGSSTQEYKFISSGDVHNILPLWDQAKFMERQLKWRQEHVLPEIMRREQVDLWIVEKSEGVLYLSLLPGDKEGLVPEEPSWLVYHNAGRGGRMELRFAEQDQLAGLVKRLGPVRIGVGERNIPRMKETLGNPFGDRLVDSKNLRIGFLEKRSPEEISAFHYATRIAHDVIAEAFSNRAVIPDVTTTDELNWWIRQRYRDLGLMTSDHPTITLQRCDANLEKFDDPPEYFREGRTSNGVNVVVRRGDVISCDTDLFLLGLVTDSHQHAYVLKERETDVPEALEVALRKVNRIQDLFRKEFLAGRAGKEIVAAAKMIKPEDGIIETELGFHPPPMYIRRFLQGGYMFDHKTYVAGMTSGPGYYPTSIVSNNHKLHANTLYAFEPHACAAALGWKDGLELGIGQIADFTENGLQYLARPQEHQWHIIK